jgi:hypothetical protein
MPPEDAGCRERNYSRKRFKFAMATLCESYDLILFDRRNWGYIAYQFVKNSAASHGHVATGPSTPGWLVDDTIFF